MSYISYCWSWCKWYVKELASDHLVCTFSWSQFVLIVNIPCCTVDSFFSSSGNRHGWFDIRLDLPTNPGKSPTKSTSLVGRSPNMRALPTASVLFGECTISCSLLQIALSSVVDAPSAPCAIPYLLQWSMHPAHQVHRLHIQDWFPPQDGSYEFPPVIS